MLGGIVGDVVGSRFEGRRGRIETRDFAFFHPRCRFTDDTVCTCAVAQWLLDGGDLAAILRAWVRRYPDRGYGGLFRRWAADPSMGPYGSWGNGAPMRVGPVGWAARDEAEVLELARASAVITHDHPEAVRAAQALAFAVFRARHGAEPARIRREVEERFGYDLPFTVEEIRPHDRFDVSAKGSTPQAMVCALEAVDFEDAVRNAVSLGGDSDTLACMAGSLAEPLFGIPAWIEEGVRPFLTEEILELVARFRARFGRPPHSVSRRPGSVTLSWEVGTTSGPEPVNSMKAFMIALPLHRVSAGGNRGGGPQGVSGVAPEVCVDRGPEGA